MFSPFPFLIDLSSSNAIRYDRPSRSTTPGECLAVRVRTLTRRSRGGPGALLWHHGRLAGSGRQADCQARSKDGADAGDFRRGSGISGDDPSIRFASLCIGLVIAGLGSSAQHPRASLLVTNTYGRASRGPLGIYDFAGDLGKATFPAAVALLLPVFAWRPVVAIMALVGIVCNRPGPCAKRRHRPWIRAVLHGRHRRRWACADRLRPHCRSFQSDRRNHGRGIDRRLHHTSDSRAPAHLTKRAQ